MTDLSIGTPNLQQQRAIEHTHGPVQITAGAGTGKTHTLTQRILHLVATQLCRPDQILALAFNNKAAAEMRERVTAALLAVVPPEAEPPTILTYHGFGNAVIAEWGGLIGLPPRPALLSRSETWLTLWDCLPRIDFQSIDLLNLRGDYGSPLPAILGLGGRLNDELATPRELLSFLSQPPALLEDGIDRVKLSDYARALLVYEAAKRETGTIDFGDQIALAVCALGSAEVRKAYRERYRFVVVDEYQDTNYAQSVMVQLLTQDFPQRNVCVVGDVRQAIYRFRGAAPDNLLRFSDDYAGTAPYTLQRNYRSTQQILDAANAIWAVTDEQGIQLESASGRQGPAVVAGDCEDPETEWEWIARQIAACQAQGVAYRDMAILFRKNDLKVRAWRALLARAIPAVMTGGTDLYRTPEVREIIAYLRALGRPSDNISLAHIASSDSFGLDEAAVYDLLGPLERGTSLFQLMVERGSDPSAAPELRLFLATFERLLADAATLPPGRVVERIVGLRRGAYTNLQQANVYRFLRVAESFGRERRSGATVASFVAYLNLLLAAPSDEDEATDIGDDDAVQLMTVHAAKGLERAVIFIACASQQDFTINNTADVLPAGLRHPAHGMPRSGDFAEAKVYQKELKKWESEQHRLEEQRLAYVALTRAKDRLFISWHRTPLHYRKPRLPLKAFERVLPLTVRERLDRADWDQPDAHPELPSLPDLIQQFVRRQTRVWAAWRPDQLDASEEAVAGRILNAWHAFEDRGDSADLAGHFFGAGIQRWAGERRRLEGVLSGCLTPALRPADADRRPVVEVPHTLSYSMLATYRECGRKAYLRFVAGFPGEPKSAAAGIGTAFHAAVEVSASQTDEAGSFENVVEAFAESAAETHSVTDYEVTETDLAMLRSFWEGPDRAAVPLYVEHEFYWRVGPGYLHGLIDRIQRCPDGSIELIDFKTCRQALTAAEARADLQLSIYALACREVFSLELDRLTLVYPRLRERVSVSFTTQELQRSRVAIVDLMESARTAGYDEVNTRHCHLCEYRLVCPAAAGRFAKQ